MSRQTKNRFAASQAEYEWLVRIVGRKAVLAEKAKDKRLKEAIAKFNEKLGQVATQNYTVGVDILLPLNRNEIRIAEELARNEHAALVGPVLRNYQDRMDKDPAHFGEAIKRCHEVANLLVGLINKLEKAL